MDSSQQIPSEFRPYFGLAMAVLRRAFRDLRLAATDKHKKIKTDAYDFLMLQLWESDNLWNAILGSMVERHTIVSAVEKICYLNKKKEVCLLVRKHK